MFWQLPHPTIYGLEEVVGEVGVEVHLTMQAQVSLGVPLGTVPLGVVQKTLFDPDFG